MKLKLLYGVELLSNSAKSIVDSLWRKRNEPQLGSPQSEQSHYTNVLDENKNGFRSKRIIVRTPPSMGKTTFVKKVAHDWAQVVDESVVEKRKSALSEFELALVINLREAATFRNLRDVINCSRIFSAEHSSLTEQLLTYITTNQD